RERRLGAGADRARHHRRVPGVRAPVGARHREAAVPADLQADPVAAHRVHTDQHRRTAPQLPAGAAVTATRALLAAPGCEQPRAAPPPRWPEDRRWRNLLFMARPARGPSAPRMLAATGSPGAAAPGTAMAVCANPQWSAQNHPFGRRAGNRAAAHIAEYLLVGE